MSSDSSYDVTAAGYDGGAVEADAVFRALVTNNLQGFMLNIRGMMVATFIMLLLWLLLLLAKYIVNLIRPADQASLWDSWAMRGGKKTPGASAMPPPPGAMTDGGGMGGGPGGPSGMGAGMGAGGAGGPGAGVWENPDWWTAGIESERGYPNEARWSTKLSRAADVARLGFLFSLGNTVVTNFSNDPWPTQLVLNWIFVSFMILWLLVALFTKSRWVPLIFGFITFPFVMAIWSLSFKSNLQHVAEFEGGPVF